MYVYSLEGRGNETNLKVPNYLESLQFNFVCQKMVKTTYFRFNKQILRIIFQHLAHIVNNTTKSRSSAVAKQPHRTHTKKNNKKNKRDIIIYRSAIDWFAQSVKSLIVNWRKNKLFRVKYGAAQTYVLYSYHTSIRKQMSLLTRSRGQSHNIASICLMRS